MCVPTSPLLNERAARQIGRTVTVETAIQNGEGRVKIGDSLWIARGPDAPAGSQVTVAAADGSCLIVEPVAAASSEALLPGARSLARNVHASQGRERDGGQVSPAA